MKIRKRTEPDLYVINRPFTESENEEISLFIANYKKTHKLIYPQINHTTTTQKAKKYEVVEATMPSAREPEPDLYVKPKPGEISPEKKTYRQKAIGNPSGGSIATGGFY